MGGKTKEQLLAELSAVQKMLEEKTQIQGHMIRKFQMLIANEGLFAQIIDFFPYPLAIFTSQYTLVMVNKAFTAETKVNFKNLEKEAAHIFPHKIDDPRLAAAILQVFAGGTFFLENLKKPFVMFAGVTQKGTSQPGRFRKAVVFPVLADDAAITHGVIVFMP
jgi:hypothetical protein